MQLIGKRTWCHKLWTRGTMRTPFKSQEMDLLFFVSKNRGAEREFSSFSPLNISGHSVFWRCFLLVDNNMYISLCLIYLSRGQTNLYDSPKLPLKGQKKTHKHVCSKVFVVFKVHGVVSQLSTADLVCTSNSSAEVRRLAIWSRKCAELT